MRAMSDNDRIERPQVPKMIATSYTMPGVSMGESKARESSKGTEGAKEDENVTQPVDVDALQLL